MPFEWLVALRFLREGRMQTFLILTGVGVGTSVIVFLSALITGLQESIIQRTLGTQAHVIVRPLEEVPQVLDSMADARVERPAQRIRSIVGWQQTIDLVHRADGVVAAAPAISGPGFALRSRGTSSILIRGIEPESYFRIVDLGPFVEQGQFRLRGFDAVIGTDLAEDLGVSVGDKIRVQAAGGRSAVLQVSGIIDAGNRTLNASWVFVSLRVAQTLLSLEGGVSTIEVRVADIFGANPVADQIAQRTGLIAESWMTTNAQLMVGLRSQSASSVMIQVFVILAVALGIASVLAVSVVQKSREIGIMRAVGTRARQVLRIFLIQGLLVGLVGSAGGVMTGIGLSLFFASLATNPDGSATFPVALTWQLYLRATAVATIVGVVAAWLPARRAARLDPADVIRYG
ncbi:MAG TPA: ABC transporter permease [Gemmatimonadales bacterium]|nr:ABC transporter permease [Gemmatimonadales bacterium]